MNQKKQSDTGLALEVVKLSTKVTQLEGQIKSLQMGQPAPEYLPPKVEMLKLTLQTLKKNMSMGRQAPDDKYRIAALEVEIGKCLLIMDGIL